MKARFLSIAERELEEAIYYVNDENEIVVVSIAHLHRKPEKYESRIIRKIE
ncbi:MAG: hypothetical protein L3J41_05515 [Melioribacteraceae bacterium]|nr:hypothetical protein [Melioribacteraceae bacterium]